MHKFSKTFRTIWANFDANRHMRHTAYNDYAAEVRIMFLQEHGFDIDYLKKIKLGPILFREETKFLREIKMGADITVDIELSKLSPDGKKYSFIHHIYNNINKELSATIVIDGAWLDLEKRKLTSPPQKLIDIMNDLEKSNDFHS